MSFKHKGKVFFIGAGPGDPELLTVKAVNILSKADVVITDRLVSEEILNTYVSPLARIIYVGKQGGSCASTSQKDINQLLVQMAEANGIVVRLKGGDVSIFSNILDELESLSKPGISYEIVPGISALSGAAAYSGIPLTARGYSTGVRILTYYQDSAVDESSWKELAALKDTLVFYMSAGSLHQLVEKLLQNGADPATPFVVVEQATTPNQRVLPFTLQEYFYLHAESRFISPSLIIIGKVTALHKQFAWLPANIENTTYFKPLEYAENPLFISDFQNQSYVTNG